MTPSTSILWWWLGILNKNTYLPSPYWLLSDSVWNNKETYEKKKLALSQSSFYSATRTKCWNLNNKNLYLSLVDVDECSDSDANECAVNARCDNLPGSYDCTCSVGFAGDGRTSCEPAGKYPLNGGREPNRILEIPVFFIFYRFFTTVPCNWSQLVESVKSLS